MVNLEYFYSKYHIEINDEDLLKRSLELTYGLVIHFLLVFSLFDANNNPKNTNH